jgi:hypothetical protein
MDLGSVTGASNFNIAGFFWPYANFEGQQYLVVGAYLYPLPAPITETGR